MSVSTKDNLGTPSTIKRRRATVPKPSFAYTGIAATGRTSAGEEFIVVANSIEAIGEIWASVMSPVLLNREKCQDVAVFATKVLVEAEDGPLF